MVSKISLTLMRVSLRWRSGCGCARRWHGRARPADGRPSCERVAVAGRVAARDVVLELALDVGEQRAGAEAQQVGLEPTAPQLLLHEDEPGEGVLGGAQAAGRLEAHGEAGALGVVADGAHHR